MLTLSDNERYYMTTILRRLREFQDALPDDPTGMMIGTQALADEIDWLDSWIDERTRKTGEEQEVSSKP